MKSGSEDRKPIRDGYSTEKVIYSLLKGSDAYIILPVLKSIRFIKRQLHMRNIKIEFDNARLPVEGLLEKVIEGKSELTSIIHKIILQLNDGYDFGIFLFLS